jgi:heptosyltransferase-2
MEKQNAGFPGRRFLLLGGPGEELIAQQISMIMDRPPIDLVGKTTVAEALALVSMCALFLSNDSGLMHVAAALNIPQVALFGSTDPQKTAPLNNRAVVIHPEHVGCTPCFKRSCPEDLEREEHEERKELEFLIVDCRLQIWKSLNFAFSYSTI